MTAVGLSDSRPSTTASVIEESLRRRIELSRAILITAIVFHHIRIPAELSLFTWHDLGYLRGYVQLGLLKTATSTLTIISGYLLFSTNFELQVARFIRKKFLTLFVPLLLWNIPIALLIFMLQSKGHYMMKYDDLGGGNIFNWANALLGLTKQPANEPLHFLRNLIACNIIALLIGRVFRRHAVGVFAVILVIGLLNLQWPIVTRNDIFIGFFLGALVAVTSIDPATIDFLLPVTVPCFLAAGFFMFYFEISYASTWGLLHRFLAFLAVWPLIGLLNRSDFGVALSKWSKYAFCLFLTHYCAILLTFAVFSQLFSLEYFYIYFIIAGPLAIGMCIAGQAVAERYFPRLLGIATGGRATATPSVIGAVAPRGQLFGSPQVRTSGEGGLAPKAGVIS